MSGSDFSKMEEGGKEGFLASSILDHSLKIIDLCNRQLLNLLDIVQIDLANLLARLYYYKAIHSITMQGGTY
jgi:hypothetical protein